MVRAPAQIASLGGELDRNSFGGKAVGLGDAVRSGFNVPPGVVVPIGWVGNDASAPEGLAGHLRSATSSLRPPFAVRSSGLHEDSADASHAGRYRTILSVESEDLGGAVVSCASDGVAVIVQEMVDATVAGVAFSLDPVSGRPGVVIEAVAGLADHLLDGSEGGERWVGGAFVEGNGTPTLTSEQAEQVVALVEALERMTGSPVDVEWAFDHRELWLLQVRPLSAFASQPTVDLPERQTWVREPRFPDPLHRLTFSNWFPIHTAAFRKVFAEFGLPVDTVEHRRVEGRVYSREVPFGGGSKDGIRIPKWVMAAALRLPPMRSRLSAAQHYDGESNVIALMDAWDLTAGPAARAETKRMRELDLGHLEDGELSDHIDRVRDHIRELAIQHFRLTLGAVMIPTGRLGLFMRKHLGWDPPATIDLVSGFVDDATSAGRMLALLSAGLSDRQREAIEFDRSVVLDVDGMDDFLDQHGHRVNVDLTKPTLAEDLGRLVHLLLASSADGSDPRARAEDRESEARAALNPSLHPEFESLLRLARRGRRYQDISELAVFDAVALMRMAALEAGSRLAASGQLPLETDVWHLDVAELQQMLTDRGAVLSDLVERRSEIAWAATHRGERRYGPDPVPPPDVDVLPRRVRQTIGAVLWSAALEAPPPVNEVIDGALVGLPGAPGRTEGTVRFVTGEEDFLDVGAGDIVVCHTAAAAWSPIFAVAGGIVTESGGALSHPATLAREYGVPAVMSVDDAMGRLQQGDWVRLDGGAGTVTVV